MARCMFCSTSGMGYRRGAACPISVRSRRRSSVPALGRLVDPAAGRGADRARAPWPASAVRRRTASCPSGPRRSPKGWKARVDRVEAAGPRPAAAGALREPGQARRFSCGQAGEDAPVFGTETDAAPADPLRRQEPPIGCLQQHRAAARRHPAGAMVFITVVLPTPLRPKQTDHLTRFDAGERPGTWLSPWWCERHAAQAWAGSWTSTENTPPDGRVAAHRLGRPSASFAPWCMTTTWSGRSIADPRRADQQNRQPIVDRAANQRRSVLRVSVAHAPGRLSSSSSRRPRRQRHGDLSRRCSPLRQKPASSSALGAAQSARSVRRRCCAARQLAETCRSSRAALDELGCQAGSRAPAARRTGW